MKNETYHKLIDLYAGRELPEGLDEAMEMAAFNDPELSHEMTTMRKTVDALQASSGDTFTEESYQRILMKIYARGQHHAPSTRARPSSIPPANAGLNETRTTHEPRLS